MPFFEFLNCNPYVSADEYMEPISEYLDVMKTSHPGHLEKSVMSATSRGLFFARNLQLNTLS